MKLNHLRQCQFGFTMVELSIYTLIAVILSGVSFSFLVSSATLATKNSNLNRSHDDLRLAFDRLAHHLSAANNVATLINENGATVANPGPAAGVKFDRVVGEPYVIESPQTANNPLAAGTVASTATSLNIFYPKNSLTHVAHLTPTAAATSVAGEGLILLIPKLDGSNIRAEISAVGARDSSNANWHKLPLTLTSAVGQGFSWGANQPQLVKIVRAEAFLVVRMFAGTARERCELRYYKDFEPMPTLSDATKYLVLCDQIGIQSGENTPFGIIDNSGDKLVQSTLRVRERGNQNWLGTDVNETFYTFFQLHVNLPSRFRPRTTN